MALSPPSASKYYINENRVATPFGITTLFCHVSTSIATSYTLTSKMQF